MSNELPPSLFVAGVELGPVRDPIAFGGFADIFRGSYKGQLVAIKRARVSELDKKMYHHVRHVLSGSRMRA